MAPATPGLRLEVSCDEPTGVFWDRETIQTRTAILFSIRVYNDRAEEQALNLSWRVLDAAGKVWLSRSARFNAVAGGAIHRRELFEAPARGGYQLSVEASSKRRGPNDVARAALPFAIVVAPTPGFRPRSFFALTTPTVLTGNDLDFYARIGARVLRSPWLPQSQSQQSALGLSGESWRSADLATLDAQMRARLSRSLATLAVIPTTQASWAYQAVPLVTRYPAIKVWEVDGETTPETWSAWARSARVARSDLALLKSLPEDVRSLTSLPSTRLALDGATILLPSPAPFSNTDAHPAALLRFLLKEKNRANAARVPAVYARQELPSHNENALEAAGTFVTYYLQAILSGTAGMSAPDLAPPAPLSSVNSAPSDSTAARMAQAAAFAAMTRLLEDASFEENLFATSPLLWGAVFRGPSSTIAAVWMAGEVDRARLRVNVTQPVEVLDVFGNSVARVRGGTLEIPLGPQPVYLVTEAPPNVIAASLRSAVLENVAPLAMQVLPLTQRPKSMPVGAPLLLRVRLQNVWQQPVTGILQVTPPPAWSLPRNTVDFTLAPGETRVYPFTVAGFTKPGVPPAVDTLRPLLVSIRSGRARWEWRQALRLATAINVPRGRPMRMDGQLSDWQDATWMEIKPPGRVRDQVAARVAVRWSLGRLFLAAQVEEPGLRLGQTDGKPYEFWQGYDALQFAFGLRDDATVKPSQGPFRDTDYGFLLSPYGVLPDGRIDGRLLRLWNSRLPFGALRDPQQWGGAVPGAQCVVLRDEQRRLTIYEASLPLTEMPTLRPQVRAQRDVAVRFSWILHNDEGKDLQWSRVAGVFPWWNHTGSFLPEDEFHLAAQTPLGFTQVSPVEDDLPFSLPRLVEPSRTMPRQTMPRGVSGRGSSKRGNT
ncbi:MAG: hypothetical protein M3347_07520, partial [Armatimonadota bacterium]|nr:hypothetical protein [Armatimonadota bacterium]